jgi:hypothetical protein
MVTKNRHSGWSSSFNEARKGKSLSEEHKKAISKTRKSGQTWYLKYLKKEEDDTSDGGP